MLLHGRLNTTMIALKKTIENLDKTAGGEGDRLTFVGG